MPSPRAYSITDAQCGSATLLRNEMGLFPFARTISSRLNPAPAGAARGWWPEVLWRGPALVIPNCSSVYSLPLSAPSRLSHIKNPSAANALHRWMLRTVERSPPARLSECQSRSTASVGSQVGESPFSLRSVMNRFPLEAVITTGHVPFALGRILGPNPRARLLGIG